MGKNFVDCGETHQEDSREYCVGYSSDEYCEEQEIEMASIISRLKQEKEKALAGCMAKGKSDGTMWAKRASYSDITSALNNSYFQTRDSSFFNEQDEIWEDFVKDAWGDDSRLGRGEVFLFNLVTEAWITGFFSGIEKFWAEVSPKVEA